MPLINKVKNIMIPKRIMITREKRNTIQSFRILMQSLLRKMRKSSIPSNSQTILSTVKITSSIKTLRYCWQAATKRERTFFPGYLLEKLKISLKYLLFFLKFTSDKRKITWKDKANSDSRWPYLNVVSI